jgi:hypothetical protein
VHTFPANLPVPREAGLLHFGVRSTYILGLQIGSILSRLTAVALAKAVQRSRLSFFVVSNVRKGWFFDIYIQGSKKIQL